MKEEVFLNMEDSTDCWYAEGNDEEEKGENDSSKGLG